MTLEFDKVLPQVERMGRALAARNITMSERLEDAWQRLQRLTDLGTIHDRIQLARQRDAGFRGAAPLHEAVNRPYPLPASPDVATILAVDGSQIYPNMHAAAVYYLINIGVFVYHHGVEHLPEQFTEPRLFYSEDVVRDKYGQVVTNAAVNARRAVAEIQVLSRECWHRRGLPTSLLAISDGPLLFWTGREVPDHPRLEADYLGSLVHMHDVHAAKVLEGTSASLVGYVDRPSSTFLVGLLHLMDLAEEEVRHSQLTTHGALEGLVDAPLLHRLLQPGERSALMVQQSPQNKAYHDKGESYEIAFFYLNVGNDERGYHMARVEMPMWVAREPALVNQVHSLLYDQCGMMWRYPYALTRADEVAVVRAHERSQLDEMIEVELRRNAQVVEHSEKLESKVSRHGRTRYGQKQL